VTVQGAPLATTCAHTPAKRRGAAPLPGRADQELLDVVHLDEVDERDARLFGLEHVISESLLGQSSRAPNRADRRACGCGARRAVLVASPESVAAAARR
jgi:hypothetical protein